MLQKNLSNRLVQKNLEYILQIRREKIKHQRKILQSMSQKKNLKRSLLLEEESLTKMIFLMNLLVQIDKFKDSMEKKKQNTLQVWKKVKLSQNQLQRVVL